MRKPISFLLALVLGAAALVATADRGEPYEPPPSEWDAAGPLLSTTPGPQ